LGDHRFGNEDFGASRGLEKARDSVRVLPAGLGDLYADDAGAGRGAGNEGAVAGYGVGLREGGVVEGEVRANSIC
jgi:hypothetical protein